MLFYKRNCLLKCSPLLWGRSAVTGSQTVGSNSLGLENVASRVGELWIQVLTLCGLAWHASQAAFLDWFPGRLLIGDVMTHSVLWSHCYCSVTKSCPALCNPMNCSTPGFSILHYLPVCSNSCPLIQWCHPTTSSSDSPFFSCPQSFPASGSFPMSQFFALGGQSVGASASASVLPMNIQSGFSLVLAGLNLLAVQSTLKSLLQYHDSKA